MDRQQVKELLPIIQAFAEGKIIQRKWCDGTWVDIDKEDFDNLLKLMKYGQVLRVKPESKFRPFKDKDECWQEMLKHQPFGWVNNTSYICSIVCVGNFGINAHNGLGIEWCDFKNALKLTFIDGTPFGIKEEE